MSRRLPGGPYARRADRSFRGCVYGGVYMARVNVYLPDELAREWRARGKTNLSQVTQVALEQELSRSKTDRWLKRVIVLRGWDVSHEQVLAALLDERTRSGGGPS